MNQVPEVAMTVIDPGDRRWAQLLNVSQPVRDLLTLLVSRLELPDKLTYELIPVRFGRKLGEGETLQGAGIYPGEELRISPVRNKVYLDLMDALYKEAIGYAAKKLWGQVESRLETIFRLDPNYPDPQGLRRPGMGTRPAAPPSDTSPAAPGGPSGSGPTMGSQPIGGPPIGGQPPTGQPPPMQQPVVAAAKGSSSCVTVGLIILGIFVVVIVVGVAGAYAFGRNILQSLNDTPGEINPTRFDEPTLGTGDVQVTLRWDNAADLDLHVTDPAGEEIWFGSPASTSGGQLDVDANGDCSGAAPVENVFWPTGGAPGGPYQVGVVYYGACDTSGPVSYEVTISINGFVVDQVGGTLSSSGESQIIGEYTR